jgi:hypothetical protein
MVFTSVQGRQDDAPMNAVTVFCAVWHKDPDRLALLASHRDNLRRQSVGVDIIYVFDGGESPPPGLDTQTISSRYPLTIYQAWNLALAAVRTPFVMNLNLDDRLAPDAIQNLITGLNQSNAVLIGGDWRICFSQDETDAVQPCSPVNELPFQQGWPPPKGVPAALGSSREGKNLGPATMWRMEIHRKMPGYPWRFSNGQAIRSIGDGIFWALLALQGCRFHRLPLIIGNYHSHPHEQAEFRYDNAAEWRLFRQFGAG